MGMPFGIMWLIAGPAVAAPLVASGAAVLAPSEGAVVDVRVGGAFSQAVPIIDAKPNVSARAWDLGRPSIVRMESAQRNNRAIA